MHLLHLRFHSKLHVFGLLLSKCVEELLLAEPIVVDVSNILLLDSVILTSSEGVYVRACEDELPLFLLSLPHNFLPHLLLVEASGCVFLPIS